MVAFHAFFILTNAAFGVGLLVFGEDSKQRLIGVLCLVVMVLLLSVF